MENNINKDTLYDSTRLALKLNIVNEVNSYMMSLIISDEKDYLSDSLYKTSSNKSYQVDLLIPIVLNSLNYSNLPNINWN